MSETVKLILRFILIAFVVLVLVSPFLLMIYEYMLNRKERKENQGQYLTKEEQELFRLKLLEAQSNRNNIIKLPKGKKSTTKGKSDFWSRYNKYLRSQEWADKKQEVFKHYGKKCSMCGSTQEICVHHKTYKRMGDENINDLVPLCYTCHARVHRFKNGKVI